MRFVAILIVNSLLVSTLCAQDPATREGGEDVLPKYAELRLGNNKFHGGGHRMRYSPDGTVLALADASTVRLLQVSSGRVLGVLQHRTKHIPNLVEPAPQTVVDLAFLEGGKKLLTIEEAGVLRLWDLLSGRETKLPELHLGALALGVAPDERSFFSAGLDGTVREWQLPDGTEVQKWQEPKKSALLSLGVREGNVVTVSVDGILYEWDPRAKKELRKIELGVVIEGTPKEYKFPPARNMSPSPFTYPRIVEFSPDGKWLFQQRGHQVWDVASGKVMVRLPASESHFRVAFSQDSSLLAAAPTRVKQPLSVFGLASGLELRQLEVGHVNSVAFSPDGRNLAYASNRTHICKLGALEQVGAHEGIGQVHDWDISPDGKRLVFASLGKNVSLYDARTGALLESFTPTYTERVRFLPDSETLVMANQSVGVFHCKKEDGVWKEVRKGPQTISMIQGTGRYFLSRPGGGLIDGFTGAYLAPPKGSRAKYSNFSFSPDGRLAVALAEVPGKPGTPTFKSVKREHHLLLMPEFALVREFKTPAPNTRGWQFTPDGRLVIQHTSPVRVVEVHIGSERGTVPLPDFHGGPFAPDGRTMIAGVGKGEITILAVADGKELYRTRAHDSNITDLRLTPQGKVISVGQDQTVLIWSADLWKKRTEIKPLKLDPDDVQLFFELLKQTSGANVAPAMKSLIAGGDITVAHFKDKLKPARGPTAGGPGFVQEVRAVEILEQIGSKDARALLATLARGHAEAFLTRDARESLERLKRFGE